MEFITSRKFEMPLAESEMSNLLWFNMWVHKLFPYEELKVGDILYWYESKRKSVVWKTSIVNIDRFSYDNKDAVKRRLKKRFGEFDYEQSYYVRAPSRGFCLAFKVKPLQRLNLLKPEGIRKFPQQGWLRVDNEITQKWLITKIEDDSILDDIIPEGTLIERLSQLNDIMAGVSPTRIIKIVSQTIRRDTELVKTLKELCQFRCQFPGCKVRIPKKDGGYYIEVAHIEPVSQGGKSVIGNLLVLCPNHHKEFDYGVLEIIEQTTDYLCGKLNGKEFEISFPSD